MSEKVRYIIAIMGLIAGTALVVWGVGRKTEIVYAQPNPDVVAEDLPDGDQVAGITGDNEKAWLPDPSRKDEQTALEMVVHSTTGGATRTDGMLHLTGLDACPT